jgi:hypothetical protein
VLNLLSDMTVVVPSTYEVQDGDYASDAYLVDPLYDGANVIKLSRTHLPGSHPATGLLGSTCDVFAHFSVVETTKTMVLVDIQGMFAASCDESQLMHCIQKYCLLNSNNSMEVGQVFVLFDLMMHTYVFDWNLLKIEAHLRLGLTLLLVMEMEAQTPLPPFLVDTSATTSATGSTYTLNHILWHQKHPLLSS